jgi:transketolase
VRAVRTAFFDALCVLASADPRVTLVVGDLGFKVTDTFATRFPAQFLNVGVAEQNMTGVAVGLALSGRIVFTYSIGNFPTLRCLEQIRNDVCYHAANVKIVTVGGGLAYGSLGASHHATEDVAMLRALPNMTVVAPGDPVEARLATLAIGRMPGPCYLRLGRAGESVVHGEPVSFEIGKAITIGAGSDVAVVVSGSMLDTAVRVARRLANDGVRVRVLSMHTIKPLDAEAVLQAARETRAIVSLEEHSVIGGLGSAVAEVLAEAGLPTLRFKRLGLAPRFVTCAGGQQYLRETLGLSEQAIHASIQKLLQSARPVVPV